mgnify:CR=1 FL=1
MCIYVLLENTDLIEYEYILYFINITSSQKYTKFWSEQVVDSLILSGSKYEQKNERKDTGRWIENVLIQYIFSKIFYSFTCSICHHVLLHLRLHLLFASLPSADLTKSYFWQSSCWWNHWVQPREERASGNDPGPLCSVGLNPQCLHYSSLLNSHSGFGVKRAATAGYSSLSERDCSSSPDLSPAHASTEETINGKTTGLPVQISKDPRVFIRLDIRKQIQNGLTFFNQRIHSSIKNKMAWKIWLARNDSLEIRDKILGNRED